MRFYSGSARDRPSLRWAAWMCKGSGNVYTKRGRRPKAAPDADTTAAPITCRS
jgi:hypothetical protein